MKIEPWTQPPATREKGFCWCGRPSVRKGTRHDQCERCRSLESRGDLPHRCGFSSDSVQDIPRSSLIQIRRACDAFLRRRGVDHITGHSYVESPFET